MWILKNSKELLDNLKSPNFNLITNIKSFDFSTLYTTIPHQKLKSRLATIIRNSFLHKNGNRRYKYLVLGREGPYFVKEHSDAKNKYTEEDIIKMLEFLVDNIFVVFAGKVFQQIVGIPMGTNCAPLLADIFLYSYEAEFIQSLLSASKKRLASQFNFTYRYIDDVLSINNPDFENYLGQMYPPELEIKDTTESNTSASYFDLLLSIGRDGQLRTSLYDKRDDFNFHITNFPFLSSNIPSSPAYGVFISQLIRYARACSSYECFILRAMRLSNKLLGQGYVKERLKSSLRKFYGRYGDLTKQYEVPLSRMLHDILDDDHIQWHPPLIGHYTNFWPLLIWTLLPNLTFYLIVQGFHRTYATGAACQQRTLTPPDTWSCPTLGLAYVLMSRPISPELVVLSLDFWISNTPRYFSFACCIVICINKIHLWRHSIVLALHYFQGMACYRSATLLEVMDTRSFWNMFVLSRVIYRQSCISEVHSNNSSFSMNKKSRWWQVVSNPRRPRFGLSFESYALPTELSQRWRRRAYFRFIKYITTRERGYRWYTCILCIDTWTL